MKEAGYENGFSATMMAPNNRYIEDARIAEAVAAMLAKINIKVDLQTMPKAQYWQRFDERAADITMIGWQSDTQDSANFYEFLAMTPDKATGYGQYNAGNYSNPEVDRLTLETQTMTDPKARAEVPRRSSAFSTTIRRSFRCIGSISPGPRATTSTSAPWSMSSTCRISVMW